MKYPFRTVAGGGAVWITALLLLGIPSLGSAQDQQDQQEETSPQEDPCLMCHSMASMFEATGEADKYVVTEEDLAGSIHGDLGLSCSSCHQDMQFPHAENAKASCSPCHSDIEARFAESLHGYALARGNPRAPDCATCHGNHHILPSSDPRSPTHKVRLPQTCAQCHGEGGLLTDQLVRLPQSFQQYAMSVHGRVRRGESPPPRPARTATASMT